MKREFDWDRFKNTENNICVHCKTKEEAENFCEQMGEHGMKWRTGKRYAGDIFWDIYKEQTVYYNTGEYGHIFYISSIKAEILEWSDYMKEKTFIKADLKEGMIVETKEPCLYLVLHKRLIGETSWIGLGSYRDDLSFDGKYREYDIQKVYKAKYFSSLNNVKNAFSYNDKSNLELICSIDEKIIISKSEAEKLLEELTDEKYEIR